METHHKNCDFSDENAKQLLTAAQIILEKIPSVVFTGNFALALQNVNLGRSMYNNIDILCIDQVSESSVSFYKIGVKSNLRLSDSLANIMKHKYRLYYYPQSNDLYLEFKMNVGVFMGTYSQFVRLHCFPEIFAEDILTIIFKNSTYKVLSKSKIIAEKVRSSLDGNEKSIGDVEYLLAGKAQYVLDPEIPF